MQSYDCMVIMNMSRGETETSTIPKAASLDTHYESQTKFMRILTKGLQITKFMIIMST